MLAASASAATAQDPGVQVDPNSPAGKEYALPVDQANQVAGTPSSTSSRSTVGRADSRPLFGEGVKPTARGASRGRAVPATGSTSSSPAAVAAGDELRSGAVPAPEPSGSAIPWLLGSGALVILIGVGVSRALKRMDRLA
jgi:hypothetical protein